MTDDTGANLTQRLDDIIRETTQFGAQRGKWVNGNSPERLLLDHALERYIKKVGLEDVLNHLLAKYPALNHPRDTVAGSRK